MSGFIAGSSLPAYKRAAVFFESAMLRICLMTLVTALLAGGCTWVKMEPAGHAVRLAAAGEDLAACKRLGEIGVAVKDQVGFYRRDPIKVQDELEVMARNEAPRLQADTLQPLDAPLNGEQRFVAWRCGQTPAAPAEPAEAAEPRPAEAAQTYPIR